jgi:hypothetical protein
MVTVQKEPLRYTIKAASGPDVTIPRQQVLPSQGEGSFKILRLNSSCCTVLFKSLSSIVRCSSAPYAAPNKSSSVSKCFQIVQALISPLCSTAQAVFLVVDPVAVKLSLARALSPAVAPCMAVWNFCRHHS